jgi:diguanylate cyclase (GGDEF)-like protein
MDQSGTTGFPESFSCAHIERLRTTYARVLPLIGVWVGTFLNTDWTGDPWGVVSNGWITLTLFAAWAVLWWSHQTLAILRSTLWLAFAGFGMGVFFDHTATAHAAESIRGGGEDYGLAILIIAAHTLYAPSGARLAGMLLWLGSLLTAFAGFTVAWYQGGPPPGMHADALRFLLAGAITVSLMGIFSRLSGLQIRSTVQNSLLKRYALTDALTELPNRRAFQAACEKEFAPDGQRDSPVSLIMLDIDRFKQVNDQHGHDAGDRVLQQLAQIVRSVIRPTDYPVRWGGDEFAILLPDTHLSHGRLMAERIRLTVESFPFDVGTVTVSIGTAQLSEDYSFDSLFRRTDKALYHAKHHGRNRIAADHGDPPQDASVDSLRLALHETGELDGEPESAKPENLAPETLQQETAAPPPTGD